MPEAALTCLLTSWRRDVQQSLREDPSGFIGRRATSNPPLGSQCPEEFPPPDGAGLCRVATCLTVSARPARRRKHGIQHRVSARVQLHQRAPQDISLALLAGACRS
jgi:hypothetical protein